MNDKPFDIAAFERSAAELVAAHKKQGDLIRRLHRGVRIRHHLGVPMDTKFDRVQEDRFGNLEVVIGGVSHRVPHRATLPPKTIEPLNQ